MNEFYLTIILLLGVSLTSYFWMSSLERRIKRLENSLSGMEEPNND